MTKLKIIGFAGPAGAGKDTAANLLQECLDGELTPYMRHSFAGPLKAMMRAAGFPEPADRAAKELPIEGFDFSWRDAAQKLGTEWGRALDYNIWVNMVRRSIIASPGAVHIITDVRFDNEKNMIHDLGGEVWHIRGRKAAMLGASAGHVSEQPVLFNPALDRLVDNRKDGMDKLGPQLDGMLSEFFQKYAA